MGYDFFTCKESDSIEASFGKSVGARPINKRDFLKNTEKYIGSKVIARGLRHNKIIRAAAKYGIDYFYIDTGYFGNIGKKKYWHRVIKNSFHMNKVNKSFSDKRYKSVQKYFDRGCKDMGISRDLMTEWRGSGSNILLCPPTLKSLNVTGIKYDDWMRETILRLGLVTDRKINKREKPRSRTIRVRFNTIWQAMDNDIWAVVTYNSIVGVESVLYGIPAFCLGPNAADPVANKTLINMEIPKRPPRQDWANNLAYNQFTVEEMISGKAWSILREI